VDPLNRDSLPLPLLLILFVCDPPRAASAALRGDSGYRPKLKKTGPILDGGVGLVLYVKALAGGNGQGAGGRGDEGRERPCVKEEAVADGE
jgi:hypothetical protein